MASGTPKERTLDVDAVVACDELEPVLDRLRALGFVVHMMMPADDPSLAVLEGGGLTVRLARGEVDADWLAAPPPLPPVAPAFELSRIADAGWGIGRAAMHYRDLLPGRQGGRFIASHIRIVEAGPVPDHVHFHRVRFQVISCVAGWVRVAYEDQGVPIVLTAGDCVLQPPGIRHQVLESSAGLEVVEVTCPAAHETWFDHHLTLPTPQRDRRYDGQQFVHHQESTATWTSWRADGFECSETAVGSATDAMAGVRTVRGAPGARTPMMSFHSELMWWFVRDGAASLAITGGDRISLRPGDAVSVPSGSAHSLTAGPDGLLMLEVTLPDQLEPMVGDIR